MTSSELQSLFTGVAKGAGATAVAALVCVLLLTLYRKLEG